MNAFLSSVQSSDPVTYRMTKEGWDASEKAGAVAAEVVLYSDSDDDCRGVHNTPNGAIGAAGAPLVVSVVIKFKDPASAARAYNTESIWGLSESDISSIGTDAVTKGTASGLGQRSVAWDGSLLGAGFYVAMWQNKSFVLFVLGANIDSDQGKKMSLSENSRIDRVDTAESSVGGRYVEPSPQVVKGKVGQAVDLTYAALTVVSANLNAPTPTNHHPAQAGNRFVSVVVDVLFHRTLGGGATWELVDASGNGYGEGSYDESLPNMPTVPGDIEHITTWYEVPESAGGLFLTLKVGSESAMVSLE